MSLPLTSIQGTVASSETLALDAGILAEHYIQYFLRAFGHCITVLRPGSGLPGIGWPEYGRQMPVALASSIRCAAKGDQTAVLPRPTPSAYRSRSLSLGVTSVSSPASVSSIARSSPWPA